MPDGPVLDTVESVPGVTIAKEPTEGEKRTAGYFVGKNTGSTDQEANYYAGIKELKEKTKDQPFTISQASSENQGSTSGQKVEVPNAIDPNSGSQAPSPLDMSLEAQNIKYQAAMGNKPEATQNGTSQVLDSSIPSPAEQMAKYQTAMGNKPEATQGGASSQAPDPLDMSLEAQNIKYQAAIAEEEAKRTTGAKSKDAQPAQKGAEKKSFMEKMRGMRQAVADRLRSFKNKIAEAIKESARDGRRETGEFLKKLDGKVQKVEGETIRKLERITKEVGGKVASATNKLAKTIGSGPVNALKVGVDTGVEMSEVVTTGVLGVPALADRMVENAIQEVRRIRADSLTSGAEKKLEEWRGTALGSERGINLQREYTRSLKKADELKAKTQELKGKVAKWRLATRAINGLFKKDASNTTYKTPFNT